MSNSTRRPRSELTRALLALGFRTNEIASIFSRSPQGRKSIRLATVKQHHQSQYQPPADWDVWFGVNPLREGISAGRRGGEDDVSRVRTLFADLDIKDTSLGSIKECERVVSRLTGILGIKPAVLIYSGHGLQPIWRIQEDNSTNLESNPDNIDIWRSTLRRWGGLVLQQVDVVRPGARIDNVYDLSRVLRCPGSINNKSEPVHVQTLITSDEDRSIRPAKLIRMLDKHKATPIGGTVGPREVKVSTDLAEAVDWVNGQPGAGVDRWEEINRPMQRACRYDDVVAEFLEGTDDERSAHNLMRNRVFRIVRLSTEGNAGLAIALALIRKAYLDVMEMRRTGKAPGEARSESIARGDFHRALTGAVAATRNRPNSPLPLRDSNGDIYINTTREA